MNHNDFIPGADGHPSGRIAQPNPEKLTEIGRFQVFTDKTWNPPALAGEYLLVRNDREAACLKLTIRHHVTKM